MLTNCERSPTRWRKLDMVNTCYGCSLRSLMCDIRGICEQKVKLANYFPRNQKVSKQSPDSFSHGFINAI